MKKLIFVFLVAFQVVAKGQNKLPVELVGFWHNTSKYISRWQECYNFFPDSTFNFHFDKIYGDREQGVFYYKGSWRVVKDTLVLSVKEKKILIDGRFYAQQDESGIVTIYQTGNDTIIKMDVLEVKKLKLKMIFNFENSMESIYIDDCTFWKIDKDPNKYILD